MKFTTQTANSSGQLAQPLSGNEVSSCLNTTLKWLTTKLNYCEVVDEVVEVKLTSKKVIVTNFHERQCQVCLTRFN
jgi:hypothetical protein